MGEAGESVERETTPSAASTRGHKPGGGDELHIIPKAEGGGDGRAIRPGRYNRGATM